MGWAILQGLEDLDVPANKLSLHMADSTSKHPVHKIGVGATGYIPSQLDVGVPSIVHLLSHGPSQLPQVGAIHVTSKHFQRSQDLHWTGKRECFPYFSALVDVLSPLHPDIMVHGSTLMKLMS